MIGILGYSFQANPSIQLLRSEREEVYRKFFFGTVGLECGPSSRLVWGKKPGWKNGGGRPRIPLESVKKTGDFMGGIGKISLSLKHSRTFFLFALEKR
jgi:hypothetical protein